MPLLLAVLLPQAGLLGPLVRVLGEWRMLDTTSAASFRGRVCGPLLAGSSLALFGYSAAFGACLLIIALYFSWTLWEGPRSATSEKD